MEKIKVNGKVYPAKEIDFNFMCLLEVEGVQATRLNKNIFNTVKCYVEYCMGVDGETAGAEINQHIINGGTLNDITDIFSKKAEESDFFQALSKTSDETEDSAKDQKDASKKEQGA